MRVGVWCAACACMLLGGGLAASATPSVAPCATRADVLGLSRVVEIDTAGGPGFGAGANDFLADGEVVLTFDDGPLRAHTSAVLKALDDHCTRATFFLVGRMAAADPAMVREVAEHGHTLATHTFSHAHLQGLDAAGAEREIELGLSTVTLAAGGHAVAPFFRYPYLRSTPLAAAHLRQRDISSFMIDVDSRDFRTRDGATVKTTVLHDLARRRKGILLFHDIQPSTERALPEILAELKARGFKVVHLVPRQPATTLPAYDEEARRLLKRRALAVTETPLAPRAPTWPQSEPADGPEVLPWKAKATPGTSSQQPMPVDASNGDGTVPWYRKWLLP